MKENRYGQMVGHSYRKQFSTREILNAKNQEPAGGSMVEQSDYED